MRFRSGIESRAAGGIPTTKIRQNTSISDPTVSRGIAVASRKRVSRETTFLCRAADASVRPAPSRRPRATGKLSKIMNDNRPQRDPRIDAYIAKSADFAKPILQYLRELVHEACPAIKENIKWGMPSFEYKGLLCGMAAFKQHCSFGFWKHDLVVGTPVPKPQDERRGMGEFGKVVRVEDLPSRSKLLAFIKKAAKLNDDGVKPTRAKPKPKLELIVPPDLAAALRKTKAAAGHFKEFSYSKRKEYIEWLTEAKTEATRERRLATAIEWIAEGKGRNWKYERC